MNTKSMSLPSLSKFCEKIRISDKKIVLCHGTFDLLHVGHLHHFKEAKNHGDILIVTLTADQFIFKGPDRPAFNQDYRSEMIAALDLVDAVAVIDEKSAIPALNAVRPDFYVKGPDYIDETADITGKIKAERELCESFGGQLAFTTTPTFSSSALLNKHVADISEELKEKLTYIKNNNGARKVVDYLDQMKDLSILFVGETIIDQYSYVDTLGKSAKDSHIATQFIEEEKFAGGVIAAANHLSELCDNVRVLTAIGTADSQIDVIEASANKNISIELFPIPGGTTTRKQRFIDRSYMRKMFEVYHMDDSPLDAETDKKFLQVLEEEIAKADLVIVTDFGHGLLSDSAIDLLQRKAKFLAVNAQTNSGNRGFNLVTKYNHADYVCLDEPEFRLAAHDKHTNIHILIEDKFAQITSAKQGVVTHGKHGCYVYGKDGTTFNLPAFSSNSVDTMGAGDAFFALSAPMAALGADKHEIALVGNIAGVQMIKVLGHRSHVERILLEKYIETLLK